MSTKTSKVSLLAPFRKSWYKRSETQRMFFILISVGPCFGGYLLFTLYPNILSVYYSFLNWDGITEKEFVGLQNFVYMFTDYYVWRALYHNLILMVTVPTIVILMSLVLSYLITHKGYPESGFYKVLYFLPNALSMVVVGLLWAFIYDGDFGILNALIRLVGIDIGDFYWLGDTKTALWAIIPAIVWGGVGFYVVIFTNAMRSIPQSLYEAAILEGASHMTRLFMITIPLINGIIRLGALFLVLATFKGFEILLILTNGGPAGSTDVIGLYMFNLAFGDEYRNYGYASAIGMLLFVILFGTKILIDRFMPNQKVEF